MKVEPRETPALLRRIMAENGADPEKPNFKELWSCFRRLAQFPVACADDALLFEASSWSFGGESRLLCSMTRQFTLEDGGEYDHMEQLQINLYYPPDALPEALAGTVWSDEEEDPAAFFERVERSAAFQALRDGSPPLRLEYGLDEV